jgi:hypothetical protein
LRPQNLVDITLDLFHSQDHLNKRESSPWLFCVPELQVNVSIVELAFVAKPLYQNVQVREDIPS